MSTSSPSACSRETYCLVTYRYLSETSPERALRWGQSISAFTPYITYVFGELTFTLTERRPRWLVNGQKLTTWSSRPSSPGGSSST